MDRLTLKDVTVVKGRGGGTTVVSGVTFHMSSGQVVGILGPNGSGKTSLIRAIAGFIPVLSSGRLGGKRAWLETTWGDESRRMTGRILLDGRDVTSLPPGDRRIALVPQNLALYPDKTVLGNISFPLLARGLSKQAARSRAAEMADWLGLSSVLHSRPNEISGGQQQRVAIGRALVGEPRLVLLDEPLASLDVLSKGEILTLISRVLRERNASAIYVTHDPGEATMLCDTVVFINEGQVQQIASPLEAYNNPRTLFVARMFAGFSGAVQGVIDDSGAFTTTAGKGTWCLSTLFSRESLPSGRKVWLAGRPRAFLIGARAVQGLSGVVTSVFTSKGHNFARVEVSLGVTLTCAVNRPPESGSEVQVGLSPLAAADLRLFDNAGRLLDVKPRAAMGQIGAASL